ncbi:hypothetical protein Baya_12147 [Bagarius yarrelli]|uniref:Uncharacterized protein n=1 Tax=Bagarius yarrelli TaxID=175774 RepID=A0A556V2D3_BAGYA|nr:hypothetical protein Baya_12147 [Bagarius yarrelli]
MACALKAELKCKDGRMEKFTVDVENHLKSIIDGVKKMNAELSVVLTGLVEEEKSLNAERGDRRVREDEDDEEEDEDDEEEDDDGASVKLKTEPPAKRLKSITPS